MLTELLLVGSGFPRVMRDGKLRCSKCTSWKLPEEFARDRRQKGAPLEDLKKAEWYIKREIQRRSG